MNNHDDKFSDLRARAEKLLIPSNGAVISDSISQSLTDINQTIHELYTYRIELELQNEELLKTQSQLQEVSQGYLDFYNFAPVAYVVIDSNGRIIKANNALASLLGQPKQHLFKQAFTDYVLPSDQDKLYLYRQALLDHKNPSPCEFRLRPKYSPHLWVKCEGFCLNQSAAPEINLVLIDITDHKQAEDALQDLLNRQISVWEAEKAKIERGIQRALGDVLTTLKKELRELQRELPAALSNVHEKCAVMDSQLDAASQTLSNILTELKQDIPIQPLTRA